MRVELTYVPGCPNLAEVRERLRTALRLVGLPTPVEERIDDSRPSPSVLLDGVDVAATPADFGPACRLDLPTQDHLAAALRRRMTAAGPFDG